MMVHDAQYGAADGQLGGTVAYEVAPGALTLPIQAGTNAP
jgi:hypothetical protein